ncbi:hypothetical protein AM588_10000049 [Phytophthora nicotianae]|uniref:Jacalin-type lectin domain-containing protein n=1 Tax=Phytophthora nicotianae TaxID=4792 RepID=A0A0W8C2G5_PHYNI|nr:hypothetical protein AM588_10000049 [Phytophthora nicotianae]
MKAIFQVLMTVALGAGVATALENGVQLSQTFGGPHGTKYSDLDIASSGQTVQAITIRTGERVNAVSLDITRSHTRIKYIQFTTSSGKTISGGSPTKDIGKDSAPAGYQLGGFVGTCGKELDSVGAIWTSITPVA